MSSRKYVLMLTIIWASLIQAQKNTPVNWEIIIPEKNIIGDEFEILFRIKMEQQWYIYSLNKNSIDHRKTSFWFYENKTFKAIDKLEVFFEKENRVHNKQEFIIENGGGFMQRIKILKANPIIKGKINYILCSKETGQEIVLEENFEIQINTTN
jgi:thiol:disulfide interchange protein DsbD